MLDFQKEVLLHLTSEDGLLVMAPGLGFFYVEVGFHLYRFD
jgi:hypothetical protein